MPNQYLTTERHANLVKSIPLPGTRRQSAAASCWRAVVRTIRKHGAGRWPLRAGVGTTKWDWSASLSAQRTQTSADIHYCKHQGGGP